MRDQSASTLGVGLVDVCNSNYGTGACSCALIGGYGVCSSSQQGFLEFQRTSEESESV